ncbi:MAG: hypothetical protein ABSA15_07530, partial [Thermoplasmata archaeon]
DRIVSGAHVVDGDPLGGHRTGAHAMSLTATQSMDLLEVLVILMGIGIFWAIYYGSDRAELPGEAMVPDPGQVDDTVPDTRGRTL